MLGLVGLVRELLTKTMATIIQRTFTDGVNKGISFVPQSGSGDNTLYRTIGVGSNWTIIRMGLLCGINEYPSQSYRRCWGCSLGFSSGSNTMFGQKTLRTFIGVGVGNSTRLAGVINPYFFNYVADTISGSFFTITDCGWGGYTTGSLTPATTFQTFLSPIIIANEGDISQRKSIIILEISSSSTTSQTVKLWGMPSSSLANRDYTSDDLLAALTGSKTVTPSARGISLSSMTLGSILHNKTNYPLDTASIECNGGMPMEVYNWYIYKVL